MAVTTAAVIGATAAAGGLAASIKAQNDAKKAAAQARTDAQNAAVDPAAVSAAAEAQALRNIERSRQIEQQYNPENAALRTGSIEALLAQINDNGTSRELQALLRSQMGGNGTYSGDVPLAAASTYAGEANSDLLNAAIAKAQSELALGGDVPLDVRNLVARNAAAQGGALGNIRLGRDISARDLGLTSLQLAQQRLTNAQGLGQAQLGANQFNVGTRQGANQFDANLLSNTNQFNASQRQNASQFDQGYLLNQAQLLSQLSSGDFAKALAAAQFGQSIQAPVVGLDPSAIANLYVGNQNATTQAGLTAAQIAASQAQGASQLGGQLIGAGLGAIGNYYGQRQTSPVVGTGNTSYLTANPGVKYNPGFIVPTYYGGKP